MADRRAPDELPRLLRDAAAGDSAAAERLHRPIEQEVRAIARRQMRDQRVGHTLRTTALVNQAWIRLSGARLRAGTDRLGFMRLASTAMRTVLVDHARRRGAIKRGGDRQRLPLEAAAPVGSDGVGIILAVDDALGGLRRLDERKAAIAEMKFFGGLETDDIARLLGLPMAAVQREWRTAKAWLQQALGDEDTTPRRPSTGPAS